MGVSRKFKIKVSRVFQECFNEFGFAILLLHESHCSYPSRRRACYRESMAQKYPFLPTV